MSADTGPRYAPMTARCVSRKALIVSWQGGIDFRQDEGRRLSLAEPESRGRGKGVGLGQRARVEQRFNRGDGGGFGLVGRRVAMVMIISRAVACAGARRAPYDVYRGEGV